MIDMENPYTYEASLNNIQLKVPFEREIGVERVAITLLNDILSHLCKWPGLSAEDISKFDKEEVNKTYYGFRKKLVLSSPDGMILGDARRDSGHIPLYVVIEVKDLSINPDEDVFTGNGAHAVIQKLKNKPSIIEDIIEEIGFDLCEGGRACLIKAYLEVMSFGNFTYFYRFCARQMGLKNSDKKIFYLLRTVKSARNGAAHDSLFLNGLREINPSIEERDELLDLIKIDIRKSISPKYTAAKDLLSINLIYGNQKICEIITCFYAYKELIISTTSRRYTSFIHPYKKLPENLLELLEQFEKQLSNFIKEVPDSLDYKFRPVRSIFIFLQLLLTSWFWDDII